MAAVTRMLLLSLGLFTAASTGGAERPDEDALRAAMVYNLVLFVEWPARTFRDTEVLVCVVSDDIELQRVFGALTGKTARGRTVRVARRAPLAVIDDCDVAYFQGLDDELTVGKIRRLASLPVLTVSSSGGVGAMVEFAMSGERLVFDVRTGALESARLRLAARVMQLARAVIKQ